MDRTRSRGARPICILVESRITGAAESDCLESLAVEPQTVCVVSVLDELFGSDRSTAKTAGDSIHFFLHARCLQTMKPMCDTTISSTRPHAAQSGIQTCAPIIYARCGGLFPRRPR